MEKLSEKNNITVISASLIALAQAAVAVFALFGTLCVTMVGFALDKQRIYLLLIACLISIFALFFHYIFRVWALSYVLEFALIPQQDYHHYGLQGLICRLYNIKNWSEFISYIAKYSSDKKVEELRFIRKEKEFKKLARLTFFPKHLGVLSVLWISVIFLILLTVATIFLGWVFI